MKNLLWTGPPRPYNPDAEQERMERANDKSLIELARKYKPDALTILEKRKYERNKQI